MRPVMCRDIADTSVGTWLTLGVSWSRGDAAGLVAAGWVDGQGSDEAWLPPDLQVVVVGDDQNGLAGQVCADSDVVAAPSDVPGGAHSVERGAAGSVDGRTGGG